MPAQATLEARGLWTNVNTVTGIPPGGTTVQRNMRVHKPGLMTPRRGRRSIYDLTSGFRRIFDAGSFLIAFADDRQVYVSSSNGTSWSLLQNWVQSPEQVDPASGLFHFYSFGLNKSFYFNTSTGIKVVSTTSGGYRPAGVPYGLNAKVRSYDTPGTALPANSRVGYRALFGLRNPDGSVELGAPSQRAIAINSSTTDTVNPLVEITIPPGIVVGKHFWQLYRTFPSTDAAADPGDDMSLVFEGDFPAAFSTASIARTDNVATIESVGPHGLQAGDVVNLDTQYSTPDTAGTVAHSAQWVPTNQATAACAYETKFVNAAGVQTPGSSVAIGSAEAGAGPTGQTWPKRRWLHSKQLGYFVFTHPQLAKIVVFKDGAAAPVFEIPIPESVDAAAISADGYKLYFVSPPAAASAPTYSYGSGMKFGVIDLVNRTLNYTVSPSPLLPATLTGSWAAGCDIQRIGFYSSASFVTRGADGVERFWMQSIARRVNGSYNINYYYTSNFGVTWNTLYSLAANSPEQWRYIASGPNEYPQYQQVWSADGQVRAFVTPQDRADGLGQYANTLPAMFTGNVRTPIPFAYGVPFFTVIEGMAINPVTGVVQILYSSYVTATQTTTVAVVTYSSNYNFASAFNAAWTTYAGATYTSYPRRMLCNGPGNLGFFQNAWPSATTTTFYSVNATGGVTALGTTTPAYNLPYSGDRDNHEVIFYAGTYIVIASIDATHFTVEAAGADFPQAPYSSVVNFNVVSVVDNVAPGAVGPALYTSPSQEGIINSNYPPPLARDIETFRGYGFYANCTVQAYLAVTLFSVGTEPIDLQVGDLVTVGNFTVEAAAAEDFPNGKFKVTLDSGSAYENIRLTVESLSECVNRYADARHGCVLVKNEDTTSPGSVYIRSLYFDTNIIFAVRRLGVPAMGAWAPAVPATATPTQLPNTIYFSKPAQGGAVPLLNAVRVGSDFSPILRIKATREVLFVFKPEGIFAMRGYAPPWQVDPFDLSNALMLQDALCQLDNNIFCVTDHGVMKVTDSGIELISLPIQNIIEAQFSTQNGQLAFSAERAYMFGDPSDHKLHMMLPRPPQQPASSNELLVYDTYTNTWFEYGWNGTIDTAQEIDSQEPLAITYDNDSNHGMYYKKINGCIWINSTKVFTERKTYSISDYYDDLYFSSVIDTIGSGIYALRAIHLTTTPAFNIVGSMLMGAGASYHIIGRLPGNWYILDKPYAGVVGDLADVYSPVWTEVQYAPTYEVNAAALNHFREVNTIFKSGQFDFLRMTYKRPAEPSDSANQDLDIITLNGVHEFGLDGAAIEHYQTRTIVPREQARCSVLTVGFQMPVILQEPEIEGVVILFNPGPMRRRR